MLRGILIAAAAFSSIAGASPAADEAARTWTLPEAVGFALENNPDAAIARERLAAAQADFESARAAYSPVVSVGTGYEASDNPGRAFGWIINQRELDFGMDFNRPGTVDNWNVHAMAEWPLYDGGRRAGSVRAARAGAESLEARRAAVRSDIAFAVTQAFFGIVQADEVIRAVENRLEALDDAIEVAEIQAGQGALLDAEVLPIRVDRARVREDLVRARHAADLARRAFVNVLGLPYREPVLESADADRFLPVPEERAPDRAELEAAQRQRAAAAQEVRVARAAQRPQVNLFGRVDHDEGWRTNGDGQSWTAGISVRYELWDGGRASGGARSARARLREATEAERKTALAVDHEAEQARLARDEVELRLTVARESLELARENARLARVRFSEGALLSTQLTDAEADLTAARVRLAVAETELAVTTAALRRALGASIIVTEP